MNQPKKFYASRAFIVFQIATFALTILLGTQLAAKESVNDDLIVQSSTTDEYSNAYGEVEDTEDC